MKPHAFPVGAAVLGLCSFAAAAPGEPEAVLCGQPAPEAAAPSCDAVPAFLGRLAGEWEGQLTLRDDSGAVSAAPVELSVRRENGGAAAAACFQGFAFGRTFEGACYFSAAADGGGFEQTWRDTRAAEALRLRPARVRVVDGDPEATFRADGIQGGCEQVIRFCGADACTVEWFSTDAAGRRTRILTMDLTRLPRGHASAAGARLDDPALFGGLRRPAALGATASVPTEPASR